MELDDLIFIPSRGVVSKTSNTYFFYVLGNGMDEVKRSVHELEDIVYQDSKGTYYLEKTFCDYIEILYNKKVREQLVSSFYKIRHKLGK